MDIFLSINNREQVIQLPIVPREFEISNPMKNETYETINQGEIKLLGQRGLSSISISSFFPSKEYPFSRDKTYFGWEYVEIINSWISKRMPIRLVASNTPINVAMTIDNFEYGLKDGSGDVYYTLSLSEFKPIRLNSIEIGGV